MTSTAFVGHHGLHELARLHNWACAYCSRLTHCRTCAADSNNGLLVATRDHKLPRSKGGSSSRCNLVLACRECNQAKADQIAGDGPPSRWVPSRSVRVIRPRQVPLHLTARPRVAEKSAWRACSEGWHETEQQADAAIAALLTATGRRFESYRCAFCQRWHVQRTREQESA